MDVNTMLNRTTLKATFFINSPPTTPCWRGIEARTAAASPFGTITAMNEASFTGIDLSVETLTIGMRMIKARITRIKPSIN